MCVLSRHMEPQICQVIRVPGGKLGCRLSPNNTVSEVHAGSAAETAGLKAGWTVVAINGKRTKGDCAAQAVLDECLKSSSALQLMFSCMPNVSAPLPQPSSASKRKSSEATKPNQKVPKYDANAAEAEVAMLKKQHMEEVKALKERQAAALEKLEKRIERDRQAAVKAAMRTGPAPCAECKTAVTKGDSFVCSLCATPVCNTHKKETSTCVVCAKVYCKACLYKIHKCSGCWQAPMLTCCALERMPCGEFESGDCTYYHHKHCRCQRGSGW